MDVMFNKLIAGEFDILDDGVIEELMFTNESSPRRQLLREMNNEIVDRFVCTTNGVSVHGKRANINRNRTRGFDTLFAQYFAENPTYTEAQFRRRFRMTKSLFLRIVDNVCKVDNYFVQRPDATGLMSLHPLQKITCALRVLAYGSGADQQDENLHMAEYTSQVCVQKFCETVITVFGGEYLRQPTAGDLKKITKTYSDLGFPGCLGAIDCTHWGWKNCPTAWTGQYRGKEKEASVILEIVADHDTWIWHSFFGVPGANNDINVLDRSPIFDP